MKYKAMMCHKGVSQYTFIIGLGEYLAKHTTPQVNLIHPSHMTEAAKRAARNKKAREARAKKVTG